MLCEKILAERRLPKVWDRESAIWEERQEEIKELLQREVYGFRPGEPEELSFTELPGEAFYNEMCAGRHH